MTEFRLRHGNPHGGVRRRAAAFAREAAQRHDPHLVLSATSWWGTSPLRALPEFQQILTEIKLPSWVSGRGRTTVFDRRRGDLPVQPNETMQLGLEDASWSRSEALRWATASARAPLG